MNNLKETVKEIENCNFEYEAGRLENCTDWISLKNSLTDLQNTENTDVKFLQEQKNNLKGKIVKSIMDDSFIAYKNALSSWDATKKILEEMESKNIFRPMYSYYSTDEGIFVATWEQNSLGEIKNHKVNCIKKCNTDKGKKYEENTTIYHGVRGSGKTTRLIEESARTGATILCYGDISRYCLLKHARELNLKINEPITVRDVMNKDIMEVLGINKILIDDMECVLTKLIKEISHDRLGEIIGYTTSGKIVSLDK